MDCSQARRRLDHLLEQGAIEPATHRCGLDLLNAREHTRDQEALNFASAEALERWGRENALRWQNSLDAEAFAERFEVGNGHTYGCIEQMLSCIDTALLTEVLNQQEPAAQRLIQEQPDSSQACC